MQIYDSRDTIPTLTQNLCFNSTKRNQVYRPNQIAMPGSQWKKDEVAVIVYFASRGAGHEGCRQILALKTAGQTSEPRSMLAVRGKLDAVRRVPGLWTESSGWIRPAVDAWLLQLGVENLQAFVGAGDEEIAMIPMVSCPRK